MPRTFALPVLTPARLTLALALVLFSAPGIVAQSLSRASGDIQHHLGADRPVVTLQERGGGGVTITHSSSLAIETFNGVSCLDQNNQFSQAQEFWRVFDLEDFDEIPEDQNFEVTSVVLGVEAANGASSVSTDVNLYTLDGTFARSNLTPVSSRTFSVSEGGLPSTFTINFSEAVVSTSDVLVVEWAIPDGSGTFSVFPGTNNDGETAPSYISSQACGLTEPTPYAEVGEGFPGVHWVVTVTGNIVPDTVPPPEPTGLTATAGSGAVTLAWESVGAGDLDGYNVYRSTSPFSSTGGSVSRLTGAPQDANTYTDDTVEQGVTYFYRVTASDDVGNESGLSNQVSVSARNAQVNASASFTFGDASVQQNYRLVALPGAVNIPLASTLSGEQGEDWRAFREEGASGGEQFSRSECTNGCQFRPGSGFWVLAENPWSVSQPFPTVDLDGEGNYAIPLRPGWNLISNPLEIDVPWQSVRNENDLSTAVSLYRWGGAWQSSPTFASASSGVAFYMLNPGGLTTLKVPFQQSTRPAPPVEPATFELTLSARVGGAEVAVATVAEAPDAARGLDDRDRYAPPGYFETVGLTVANAELESAYQRLRRDARPPSADGHEFELVLTGEPGTMLELVPTFEARGTSHEAVLVHPVSGERHALRAGEPVRLRLAAGEMRFNLRVGTGAYVRTGTAVPTQVEAESYPNPFAEITTIRYGLPESDRVRLAVYNLLGERVAVLLDGEAQDAGYHTVVWQPDVASGVYVYVLESRSQRLTGKLTVLR